MLGIQQNPENLDSNYSVDTNAASDILKDFLSQEPDDDKPNTP